MKLGTLADGTRDGRLVVVRRDLQRCADATAIAPNLQTALDDWDRTEPLLRVLAADLESGAVPGEPFDPMVALAPLPRAYEWMDGSAYLNHVRLVRRARNAEPPPTLETDPLVYQGGSGVFLAPRQDIPLPDPTWGLDFEAEVCVILGDTPQGTKAEHADRYVRLLLLCNDVTLRNLVPAELAKGFGFFQSKPATAFSPVAVTPDELGDLWRDGRLHLPLCTWLNGKLVGDPEAGEGMHFSFFDLIQHVCKTRSYTAGTILGSGTVSNEDRDRGSSCLSEVRTLETLEHGQPSTPWLQPGDRVCIEMKDSTGASVFGTIEQTVRA
jgi:fumarylacetoacetate (FAA) hydrolase